jgi:hypothetical protein
MNLRASPEPVSESSKGELTQGTSTPEVVTNT